MHICILTSARVFDIAYGGEERFATSLGTWLANKSHDVILMGSGFASIKTKRISTFGPRLDSKNVDKDKMKTVNENDIKKIRIMNPPYAVYSFSRLIMAVLWFAKILLVNKKTPIELIHAQDTGYSGLAAVMSGKCLGIPIIISSHGIRYFTLQSAIRGKLKKLVLGIERRLDIFVIKNADRFLVVNDAIKQYFQQILGPNKRIDVIPIGIKLKDFEFSEETRKDARKELGITIADECTKVVGFVGRFSPEKNLFTLLSSFSNIVKDYHPLKLVLIGTGQLEPELKLFIKEKTIEDKVTFSGVRYDVGRMLAGIDIFVLPSYAEGLSTALLEAMASGRAIVCSDIPANRQLIDHNKEGLLVNPNDSHSVEHAIQLLIKDDALRLMLGQNAKIRAQLYDEDKVFSKIAQYYEMLCAAEL